MIKVNKVKDIWLAYDRQSHGHYGTDQPPYAFPMKIELRRALENVVDMLEDMGWKQHIKTILSAGAYVDRQQRNSTRKSPHATGLAIDIDGLVLHNGSVYTTIDAPERAYWRFAAVLGLNFGTVLHRLYSDGLHIDHFHVDLTRKIAWRPGSESQAKLVQAILTHVFDKGLVIDGKVGPKTNAAWLEVVPIPGLDIDGMFIELLQRASIGY